jgi:hypothetical protein
MWTFASGGVGQGFKMAPSGALTRGDASVAFTLRVKIHHAERDDFTPSAPLSSREREPEVFGGELAAGSRV